MVNEVDRLPMLRAKIVHLETLLADIDRSWRFMPKLFWLSLIAIPVSIRSGIGWGILSVGFVCSLVGVVAYVLGVRRQDYLLERDELQALTTRLGRLVDAGQAGGTPQN